MGLPDIRNVVARIGFFLKNKFAAVMAGIDANGVARVLRTNANGDLNISANLEESPQIEVVNVENVAVNAPTTTPQTEFLITDPGSVPVLPATKRFTVGAKISVGSGNINIDFRTSAAAAWIPAFIIPIAAPGTVSLSYIPSWPRYRIYYKATVNSTGVYFVVMTHPML